MNEGAILLAIGVPYKDHGRSPREGFDCIGLVEWLLPRAFDIRVPDYAEAYLSADADNSEIADREAAMLLPVSERESRPGDVVLFDVACGRHVGVLLGDGRFIHTMRGRDTCIERLDSPTWRRRARGSYRFA